MSSPDATISIPDDGMAQRKVLLLYHGGTAGMKHDEQGSLHPVRGFLLEQLNKIDELRKPGMPGYDIIEFDEIVDSSDVTVADWALMCKFIETNYHSYDGFVIIHGTDTMAYSASALSFMLENLAKPVIFVGAQLPFGEVHSDARRNISVAILIAGLCHVPEVCIFFNDRLYRGNRSVKIDSVSVSAFESPNFPHLGSLGTEIELNEKVMLPSPKGRFTVHTKMNEQILVLRLVPGFAELNAISHEGVKGIILLLYGTGNAPGRRRTLLDWVKKMVDAGVFVVVLSQCLKGRVDLHKYAVGRQLEACGVIPGADMTCEAATAKLSYLIGRGLNRDQIISAMQQNIRGELTPHNQEEDLFKTFAGVVVKI